MNLSKFEAGRLKYFITEWEKYTSDPHILQNVKGMKINFIDDPPVQNYLPYELRLQENEMLAIDLEIDRLLEVGVIKYSQHEVGEYVSTVFTRAKKDGNFRMILNLAKLNEHVEYYHFKMDTFDQAIKLITPNCYLASIDMKDAYYSIAIAEEDQKYLKFTWRGQLYQFTALPNGLTSGPREFTKTLKPPFSHLRRLGHTIIGYIDDTLLVAQEVEECEQAVSDTAALLQELGFVIHPTKSVTTPVQEITFLGFVINSVSMTVRLTDEKCESLKALCKSMLNKHTPTIHEVSSLVGKLVASLPGVQYGKLHYRELEKEKAQALKFSRGDYSCCMVLSERAKDDIRWWLENIDSAFGPLNHGPPNITLKSDASGKGWGITDGESDNGGRWNPTERERADRNEINYLELWASFMGLRAYCTSLNDLHVRLRIDNTTAISYINEMGGTKSHDCNELAKEVWEWCIV